MQPVAITLPQEHPKNWTARAVWMTAGLLVALVLCAVRLATYMEYLEAAGRV